MGDDETVGQVWIFAKYMGLGASALLLLMMIILLIQSALWDRFNQFGYILKGAAIWALAVVAFYSSIFPQSSALSSKIPISNIYSSVWWSGGSTPKPVDDTIQINKTQNKVVGESEFDNSITYNKSMAADTSVQPAFSHNESDIVNVHYFLPNSGGNGYFSIAPGDRVETFIGEKINIDFKVPYEAKALVQLNDLAINDRPTATNPNITWISFTTVRGENKISITVDDMTHNYFFDAEAY